MNSSETIIKIDFKKILNSGKPVVIELGCGQRKYYKDSIGIDFVDLPGVDIVADLEQGLSFLPDNSVDEIHSRHFLEHVVNFENLIRETTRVLKKGGRHTLIVPHFSNPFYYSDYSHKRAFGLYTFFYFVDPKYQLRRKVPCFYTDIRIKVLSQKYGFKTKFNPFKLLLGPIFNLHRCLQEFYEENLCFIFHCYELKIVYTPDK